MAAALAAKRARSNSLKQGLEQVPNQLMATTEEATALPPPLPPVLAPLLKAVPAGFFSDLVSFQWMIVPATSLKILLTILALWATLEAFPILPANPLSHLLFISYPLPLLPTDDSPRYGKGRLDVAFLAFYIIVFSFLRQAVTEYLIRPFAVWSGLKTETKQVRFMEQAYAIIYNLASGGLGLWVMYNGKTWWYQTEHLWLEYPHSRMTVPLKYYYLLQTAYWLQQMLVLSLRLEKPRSDYYQLIVHHVVTLWLIGWSYSASLTQIGVAIFVSMDIPEVFLGASKCLNYVGLQHCSEVSFVALLAVWTYMRHYLNIKILWSVWKEFHLIPLAARSWVAPADWPDVWWIWQGLDTGTMPAWMQHQIFAPIFLLQLVNGFWSFLLWRILWRLVLGTPITDTREEGESDDEDEKKAVVEKKKKDQ